MKSKKRVKFWKRVVVHFRSKQLGEMRFHEVWGFHPIKSKKKIERYIAVEKWAIKRLISAIETYQKDIEFEKGFYNTMLKESRPNIEIKEFELEETDL